MDICVYIYVYINDSYYIHGISPGVAFIRPKITYKTSNTKKEKKKKRKRKNCYFDEYYVRFLPKRNTAKDSTDIYIDVLFRIFPEQ